MDKDEILAGYGAWLRRREYSPATIEKYTGALARFLQRVRRRRPPARRPSPHGGTAWRRGGIRPH